jgi:hypothetical protein
MNNRASSSRGTLRPLRGSVLPLAALLLLLSSTMACSHEPRDDAVARVQSFVTDLAAGRYESAANQVRSADGSLLTSSDRSTLIAEWRRAYGDGTRITIDRFSVTAVRASTREELPATAAAGFQVVFSVEGTSRTPCFALPNPRGTERVALLDGAWFVIPDTLNTLRPPSNCNATPRSLRTVG